MSPSTAGLTCPNCTSPLDRARKFCGNCGADISGVWGSDGAQVSASAGAHVEAPVDKLAMLLTEATLGDYDIYGELGRGGMAAVYLALDLPLNRLVAIKTMLPELVGRGDMVERFRREAQTSAALSHPHIVQIYAVKQTASLVYFVMKLIEGRSLESVMLEKGRMSADMTQVILGQVAGALAYAHKKHVVHRDIKPANIMLDENGWAIVTDFGIAKVQATQNLTATGTAVGTPHYMSPEQFHNKAITGASDQYSLGIVAYEMLVGAKPFGGTSFAEIITKHLFETPKDIRLEVPNLPESLAAAVMRMLAKDPADRFPDLESAAVALGTPQHASTNDVRTQIISIANAGEKKARISIPISPIPSSKPAQAGLATRSVTKPIAVAPAAAVVVPPRPVPTVRNTRFLVAIAAVIVVAVVTFVVLKRTASAPTIERSAAVVTPQPVSITPPSAVDSASGEKSGTETPVPPPSDARLNVVGLPANGIIVVDGQRHTDRDFTLTPGVHNVRLEASGFEPMSRRVTARAGATNDITFARKAVVVGERPEPTQSPAESAGRPNTATSLAVLRLLLTPPAMVFIDGKGMGEQSRIQDSLVAGTHTLRVERSGWLTKDTVVTLGGGSTTTLRLQLTERKP